MRLPAEFLLSQPPRTVDRPEFAIEADGTLNFTQIFRSVSADPRRALADLCQNLDRAFNFGIRHRDVTATLLVRFTGGLSWLAAREGARLVDPLRCRLAVLRPLSLRVHDARVLYADPTEVDQRKPLPGPIVPAYEFLLEAGLDVRA